jgi:hypothetical protein
VLTAAPATISLLLAPRAEADLRAAIPTPAAPVVAIRLDARNWIVRRPLSGGDAGDYEEWALSDLGSHAIVGSKRNKPLVAPLRSCWQVTGSWCVRGSVRRTGYDGVRDAFSTWEPVFNFGRLDAPLATYGFVGPGHWNLSDRGEDANEIPEGDVGTVMRGTAFAFAQSFNIVLPEDGRTPVGTITYRHRFDADALALDATVAIAASGIGWQNSYAMLLPVTGMDTAKFDGGEPFAIGARPKVQAQLNGPPHATTIGFASRAMPDLVLEGRLVNGSPGSPYGWSENKTSSTFVLVNPTDDKAYFNFTSGDTAIAVSAASVANSYRWRIGALA